MALIDEICTEIRNYFCEDVDKHIGTFTINDGVISPSLDLSQTSLIRIVGSRYNDGVHYSNETFADETFHGGIWVMSPPQAFLDLYKEIETWQNKYGSADSAGMSPYQTESFGGYSYSKPYGSGELNVTWQSAFRNRLKIFRRARL